MPVYPISFSIPESKIIKQVPTKTKQFATVIPGHMHTYVFSKEQDYYEDYQKSMFGYTMKKAGWDCLRHYEILANGCIPWFIGLENCPKKTMTHFPKSLILDAMNSSSPQQYVDNLLEYTREHLTCRAMASYVLKTVGRPDATSVLFLSTDLRPDYLRCLTLIGFKQLLGKHCYENIIVPHIYDDYGDASNKYGKGFTYSNIIPASDKSIMEHVDVVKHKFDLIVYALPHRDIPLFELVSKYYAPNEIIFMCGEDQHSLDCKHFSDKGYHLFIRELF
jgi:hypothetical protein